MFQSTEPNFVVHPFDETMTYTIT